MRFSLPASLFLALALVSSVVADLKVTEPSTAHWWVAQSTNTLAWEGSDPSQFSVFLSNPDQNVLTSLLALTSVTYAYDRSKTINPGGITPANGYVILLTDPINSTNVYARSETFEIKPVNSEYPPQITISPSASVSGSGAADNTSGSATSSSAEASQTGGNSAGSRTAQAGWIGVVLAAVGAMAL